MPTYAVLGATGQVGSSIVSTLLESPANNTTTTIHAYCRSKDKFYKTIPGINSNANVKVFEGTDKDINVLASALKNTSAAFLAIAIKGNQPGTSISQATAKSVIAALERLRDEDAAARLPRLIVLSSASTEHRLMGHVPTLVRNVIYMANSNIYHDLEEAERYLRSQSEFVVSTFVKPSALSHDQRRGHRLSFDESFSPLSFADLAAGMVEIAEEGGERFDGKSVSVNATGDTAIPYESGLTLFRGLLVHFFPFLFQYIG